MIRCVLSSLVAAVILLGGCMHAPLQGANRGLVAVKNMQMKIDDPRGFSNIGVLTGIAIDDHVVLTTGHAFLTDPVPGHPLKINQQPIDYSIIADGWLGRRHGLDSNGKTVLDQSLISHDYLFLRTDMEFPDHAELVALEFDRNDEITRSTLVTREMANWNPVAIPIGEITVSEDGHWMMIELKSSRSLDVDRLRVSGSPLIGSYQDGTLVLLGIASSSGSAIWGSEGFQETREDQVFFTPAYLIPWDQITD